MWKILVANGFDVGINVAIEHVDDAGGINCEIWVVGDHNNSIAFGVDGFELLHHDVGGTGIEIAGRLVGQDDFWVGNERASDGGALLLPARELGRHVIFFIAEMETLKYFVGSFFTASAAVTSINKGHRDIVENVNRRDKIKILENETNQVGANFGFLARAEAVDRLAIEEIGAKTGAIEQTNDVEEGSLATARWSHNHNKLAALNIKVEIF